jgi:hypothetical protein
MPTWGNAIQAFVAAVAVKSAVDQKKANRARRKQLIIHHLHCRLIPNSSAFWVKVLSA